MLVVRLRNAIAHEVFDYQQLLDVLVDYKKLCWTPKTGHPN